MLEKYIAWMSESCAYASDSILNAKYVIKKWLDYALERGRNRQIAAEYLAPIENPRTKATTWNWIKNFEKWYAEQVGAQDWTVGIHVKQRQRVDHDHLTQGEIAALLDACGPDWQGRRDYTIILLYAHTAARRDEIRKLRKSAVDLDGACFSMRLKGGGYEPVHLTPDALMTVRAWLPQAPGEFLFPAYQHRASSPISRSTVRDILNRAAQAAGIARRVHPHLFRHTTAQALLDAETPLEVVQRVLHHKNILTTMLYAKASDTRAARALDRVLSKLALIFALIFGGG